MVIDMTDEVVFGGNDGDSLPVQRCVCGKEFAPWGFMLGMDSDRAKSCPGCGRKMYFEVNIRVFVVYEE